MSLEKHILNAYNALDAAMLPLILPSDYPRVQDLIMQLADILFATNKPSEEEIAKQCMYFYIQYRTRRLGSLDGSHLYPDVVADRMVKRFENFDARAVHQGVDVCMAYVYEFFPDVKSSDAMIKMKNEFENKVAEFALQNEHVQHLHLNDAQYGLVPEKPIFVAGFAEAKRYLAALHSHDGSPLTFNRAGSAPIAGIIQLVDIYSATLPNGTAYGTIFISNYGTQTSTKAPQGYHLILTT